MKIVATLLVRDEAERWPGASEERGAATEHEGPILVDEAECGEASGQLGAGHFDLPVALGFQPADRAIEVTLADLRERAEAAEVRRRAQWEALSPEARAAVWIALGEAG